MFEGRTELKEQLSASKAEIERLETELQSAQAQASESADKDQRIAELQEDFNAAKAELESEQSAHEATKLALEAELAKTTPEALQALVTEELAKASHAPIDNVAESETGSTPSKYEEYRKLQATDPHAAAKFWEENEAAIKAEA